TVLYLYFFSSRRRHMRSKRDWSSDVCSSDLEIVFFVNGRDVQTFGSQGQQRTTALSVKLAEIELIHSEIGEYPILLLDDVLSELDDYRQSHLLNAIQGKVQTFVTTTSVEGIDHDTLNIAATYEVVSGSVTRLK